MAGREGAGTRLTLTAAACLLLVAGCGQGDRRACEPAPVREGGPPAFTNIPDVPEELSHAVSDDGEVVAFFFEHPLRARSPRNKVLWVVGTRAEAEPLRITARRAGRTVRSRGGINMFASGQIQRSFLRFPEPGCWRLHLRSGARRTTLDVRVEPA